VGEYGYYVITAASAPDVTARQAVELPGAPPGREVQAPAGDGLQLPGTTEGMETIVVSPYCVSVINVYQLLFSY